MLEKGEGPVEVAERLQERVLELERKVGGVQVVHAGSMAVHYFVYDCIFCARLCGLHVRIALLGVC